jgi:penicillin-binding protein 1A
MQVVKNAILGTQQTLDRKTREAILALRLEEQFTKDQILERYLNTAYFGNGAYGVQAAAETYWGVDQPHWGQAPCRRLIRSPNGYSPIRYRSPPSGALAPTSSTRPPDPEEPRYAARCPPR